MPLGSTELAQVAPMKRKTRKLTAFRRWVVHGNEDFILYTSFAPQDEMAPKYLLGKLDDKELQLLVSERAKDMFKTWKKIRTAEMKRHRVTI
jgi:hypothetical protein